MFHLFRKQKLDLRLKNAATRRRIVDYGRLQCRKATTSGRGGADSGDRARRSYEYTYLAVANMILEQELTDI